MNSAVYLITFLQIFIFAAESQLIRKCKLSDTECLKISSQEAIKFLAPGIPMLGVQPLDVMKLDHIDINIGELILANDNISIKGFGNLKVDDMRVDVLTKKINIVFHTDIVMTGQYKTSGKLLILPISGNGDMLVKLKNIQYNVTLSFEFMKNADDKDIIHLKGFSYKYDVKGNMHFDLSNLFNGNKELSDNMLLFMNENWKVLSEEFGGPLVEASIKKLYTALKKLLKSQPLESFVIL